MEKKKRLFDYFKENNITELWGKKIKRIGQHKDKFYIKFEDNSIMSFQE